MVHVVPLPVAVVQYSYHFGHLGDLEGSAQNLIDMLSGSSVKL
jgi:hypothetical protein